MLASIDTPSEAWQLTLDAFISTLTPIPSRRSHQSQILPEELSEELQSSVDIFIAGIQHQTAARQENEFNRYIEAPQKNLLQWKEENLVK